MFSVSQFKEITQWPKEIIQWTLDRLCLDGNFEEFKKLYTEIKESQSDFDFEDGALAYSAAKSGNVEILKLLFQEFSEAKVKEYAHNLAVHAADQNHVDCLEFLMEKELISTKEFLGTNVFNHALPAVKEFFLQHLPETESGKDALAGATDLTSEVH